MKTRFDIDARIYIAIRYFSFTIAAGLSVLLNIMLFQSLTPGSQYSLILLGMSFVIEAGKVGAILTRNVFASIYKKVQTPSVATKRNSFLAFYLIMAVVSVVASIGFTVVITTRSETFDTQEVTAIERSIERMTGFANRIDDYESASRLAINEWPPYIEAREQFDTAQTEFNTFEAQRTALVAQSQAAEPGTDERERLTREANAAWAQRPHLLNVRNNAERNLQTITARHNDARENAQEAIASAMTEFEMWRNDLGLASTNPHLAIGELERNKDALERQILEQRGMGYMFDVFGGIFGVSATMIKLILLFIVALVIELIIYQSSPDIKVTRRVLYFFRNALPADSNIDELLKKFDDELERFTPKEEEVKKNEKTDNDDKGTNIGLETNEKNSRTTSKAPRIARRKRASIDESVPTDKVRKVTKNAKKTEDANIILETQKANNRGRTNDKPLAKENRRLENSNVLTKKVRKVTPVPANETVPPKTRRKKKDDDKKPILEAAVAPAPEASVDNPKEISTVDANDSAIVPHDPGPQNESRLPGDEVQSALVVEAPIRYRFGKASSRVASDLVTFINACVNEVGPFKVSPDHVREQMKLSHKAVEIFLKNLSNLRLKSVPLITQAKDGSYFANFSAQEIIDYATEVIGNA